MKIEKTNNTPEVIIDKDSCELVFRGASYPENATRFYNPIKEKIIKCFEDLNGSDSSITIICEFSVLNSISTKYIYSFFKLSDSFSENNKPIKIKWYYEEDDEDMENEGEIFKDVFKNVEFELLSVDDLDNI